MTTTCLDCGVSTGVGPSSGSVGLPSLDESARGRRRHPLSKILTTGGDADTDETFGYIYSGFKALGLRIHSLEAYRAFLMKHRRHRLFEWGDDEDKDRLPAEIGSDEIRFRPYKEPSKGYTLAKFVVTCSRCGDTFESDGRDWVKPMRPRVLTPAVIALFHKRVGIPSESCIRDADPFNVLYSDLDEWLADHKTHRPKLALSKPGDSGSGLSPAAPNAPPAAAAYWRLVERLSVVESRYPPNSGVPVAGPRFLAFNTREFRGLLERRTHQIIWKGRLPLVRPCAWHSESLLLLWGLEELGVWNTQEKRFQWRMKAGNQPCVLFRDAVVVFPDAGGFELREVKTGALLSRHPLRSESPGELHTAGGFVLHDTEHAPDTIVAVDLARGRGAWSRSLSSFFRAESSPEHGFECWASASGEAALVRQGSLAALLRLADGEVLWHRHFERGLSERVVAARNRFACVAAGRFLLIDEESGATVADRLVDGLQERDSVVAGDVIVTPTRTGRLLTHSLDDGKLVDEARFQVAFTGAAFVDRRLYVAVENGSQWLFEANPEWRT